MRTPNINPWAIAIIAGLAVAIIAVAVLWLGILKADAASSSQSNCPDGYVCSWDSAYYNGAKQARSADWASGGYFGMIGRSIKNHFGDRSVRYRNPREPAIIGCVRPQGEVPITALSVVAFTLVDISPRGAGCGVAWAR